MYFVVVFYYKSKSLIYLFSFFDITRETVNTYNGIKHIYYDFQIS